MLLLSGVDDRDTIGEESICDYVLRLGEVTRVAKPRSCQLPALFKAIMEDVLRKARIIMVFSKIPQQGRINAVRCHGADHTGERADAATWRGKGPHQGVIAARLSSASEYGNREVCYAHWVVQDAIDIVLVVTCVRRVAIKNLADAVDTSRAVVAWPERLLYVLDRVYTQPVN